MVFVQKSVTVVDLLMLVHIPCIVTAVVHTRLAHTLRILADKGQMNRWSSGQVPGIEGK